MRSLNAVGVPLKRVVHVGLLLILIILFAHKMLKRDGTLLGLAQTQPIAEKQPITEKQPIVNNVKRLPSSTSGYEHLKEELQRMENNFKIFVYDINEYEDEEGRHPFHLRTKRCGISAGHNKGYGVERYFVDRIKTSVFRTTNPMEADMFLIPILPCAAKFEFYDKKATDKMNHHNGINNSEKYVANAVKYISTKYPFYNGTRPHLTNKTRKILPMGSDHFWFSTHDGGATRARKAGGAFLRNTVALVNTADESMKYKPCWHISLPCNCDFTRPPPPDQYDKLFSSEGREPILFFAGNLASNKMRKTLYERSKGDSFFRLVSGRMNDVNYTAALHTSTFCLHLRGFQVWSPRLIEYIWFGCIPVIIGDDYYLPYSSLFDWEQISIRICEGEVANMKEILTAISPTHLASLRANLKKVAPHFIYHRNPQPEDAFYMGIYQLYQRHKYNQALAENGL
eukprot:Ihof_evm8s57 gene=Ihof_evmTU8s57